MRALSGVLGQLTTRARLRADASQQITTLAELRASIDPRRGARRSLARALRGSGGLRVIAEIKRRSPSRGAIRDDLDPALIAAAYESAGAAAISVLTEPALFGGSLADLTRARAASTLPFLRKDFIVDPYQIWEARRAGADAALLIAKALDDAELSALLAAADDAEIDALVEVHDRDELDRSLRAGAKIIGVNSRDLTTLAVRLETAFELGPRVPRGVVAVAESGIHNADDARRLRAAGFDALLIGEHFMRSPDPGAALRDLIRSAGGAPSAKRAARTPAIKICGVTSVDDALMAAEEGADLVGLVFWPPSRRYVDRDTARRINAALPPHVERVGVFVDATRDELLRAADDLHLDALQLHGSEPPEALSGLPRRVIKAVRVGASFQAEEALRYAGHADVLALDTASPIGPGGTGSTFDWSIAAPLVASGRAPALMLAGGLTPENVGRAIEALDPYAVDVSSGVESSPGRKDRAKIRAFVEAARRPRIVQSHQNEENTMRRGGGDS